MPRDPVSNALMRRIFLPDENAPTHCSFDNCNAPLDRCMPKVRSVNIAVSASYLNALVECVLLCLLQYDAFLQINEIITTPTGL